MASTNTQIAEITREPLLPTEIGDSADAESESLEKSALGKLISEEDVPRGPYPIKTKTAGWALMYLSDEDRYAYYKKKEGNPSRLDVGWQHVNTGKNADKVTVTIRQQIFDHGKKKLVVSRSSWQKELSVKQAHDILANERKIGIYTKMLSKRTWTKM